MNHFITERVHEAPVTTIRITPLDDAGNPDHRWAFTFHCPEPVYLATARRMTVDTFDLVTRSNLIPPYSTVVGALIADQHTDPHQIQALAYALWQRRHDGAAVEAWADIDTDSWTYLLIPAWQDLEDTGHWTVNEPGHRLVSAVGRICEASTYTWPDPHPIPTAATISPRSHYLMGTTPVPPPAPGYPEALLIRPPDNTRSSTP